mgnify:CR=1 FL=1|tara:strand:+ start:653 stop:1357 length:705 start_codon:yes stop_codon:yes gene_type:complete
MAKSLFSAAMSAGSSEGKTKASMYKSSSYEQSANQALEMGQLKINQLNKKFDAAGQAIVALDFFKEGFEKKKKLETEYLPELEKQKFKKEYKGDLSFDEYKKQKPDEYSKLFKSSEVKRDFWDVVKGEERTYKFGDSKDAKTYSKSILTALGEKSSSISMADEFGMSDYGSAIEEFGMAEGFTFGDKSKTVSDITKSTTWANLSQGQQDKFNQLNPEGGWQKLMEFISQDKSFE